LIDNSSYDVITLTNFIINDKSFIKMGEKIKKTILVLGVIAILICPIVLSEHTNIDESTSSNEHKIYPEMMSDDPPEWANGKFNGTWGISLFGLPVAEMGYVYGYYNALGIFGRLEGYFGEWKDPEPVSFITGFIILFNMVGYVGSIENPDNGTFYSGLGAPNENGEFYYRINLIVGPSWYIEGTWEEL
jgi:hypothetical protein